MGSNAGTEMDAPMAGLLFLMDIAALVLLAYWAYRNANIPLDEGGSGFFAMKGGTPSAATKARPRWKQVAPETAVARAGKTPKGGVPRWRAALRRPDEQKR